MDCNCILPCGSTRAFLGRQELNEIVREVAREVKFLASLALRSWGRNTGPGRKK